MPERVGNLLRHEVLHGSARSTDIREGHRQTSLDPDADFARGSVHAM